MRVIRRVGRLSGFGLWLSAMVSVAAVMVLAPERACAQAVAACPSAETLAEALAPLLEPGMEIGDARARDLGDRYVVEVAGATREVVEPARDCHERARVAAVFIALNLASSQTASSQTASSQTASSQTANSQALPDDAPAPMSDERLFSLGVSMLGSVEAMLDAPGAAGGAQLGVWLELFAGSLQAELSGGVLSASELRLPSVAGTARMQRWPLLLSVSYRASLGALSLGPVLGLALDVLQVEGAQGAELSRPRGGLRLWPGGLLGADLQLRLGSHAALRLRLGARGFARSYRVVVDPLGPVARTPQLWLHASAGVELRFF